MRAVMWVVMRAVMWAVMRVVTQLIMAGTRPSSSRGYRSACCLLLPLLLAGCITPEPPLYRWGAYEDIIYSGYRDSGSSDPANDALLLSEDMARTEAEGLQVPPGVRIHLGYLYFEQGRDDEAMALFEMERELFPESAVFVNGLLDRMGASR
jgi:hypothetical protein